MPRYRIVYSKKGPARYTSHLDLVRVLERAMRRAHLPVAYSEGFNPHPRFSFAAPLPVGTEGLAEMAEVDMTVPVEHDQLKQSLNEALPPGLKVHLVTGIPDRSSSLMSRAVKAAYEVHVDGDDLTAPLDGNAVQDFLDRDIIEVTRKGKDGHEKIRDIKPGIIKVGQVTNNDGLTVLLELKTGSDMSVRPEEAVVALFKHAGIEINPDDLQISRTGFIM